jgi:hypothetical protein
VGLGGLEPPTSPLSGARSSHLSYRPCQASEETTHISFSLRCLSFVCNCVQILKLRWPRFFGHRWRSRAPNARSASGFSSIRSKTASQGGSLETTATCTESAFFVKVAENEIPLTLQRFSKLKSLRPCSLDSITHRGQLPAARPASTIARPRPRELPVTNQTCAIHPPIIRNRFLRI